MKHPSNILPFSKIKRKAREPYLPSRHSQRLLLKQSLQGSDNDFGLDGGSWLCFLGRFAAMHLYLVLSGAFQLVLRLTYASSAGLSLVVLCLAALASWLFPGHLPESFWFWIKLVEECFLFVTLSGLLLDGMVFCSQKIIAAVYSR